MTKFLQLALAAAALFVGLMLNNRFVMHETLGRQHWEPTFLDRWTDRVGVNVYCPDRTDTEVACSYERLR